MRSANEVFSLSIALLMNVIGASSVQSVYAQGLNRSLAVEYCEEHTAFIHLSEDATILCFDGSIFQTMNKDKFHLLKTGGLFVIRSGGGDVATAIEIANVLQEKEAEVIIHDYCLSSCANYIFAATTRTYVMKDSVVAWHGGPAKLRCDRRDLQSSRSAELSRLASPLCQAAEMHSHFFAQRNLSDRHLYRPQTEYTKWHFRVALTSSGRSKNVFWMWNPAHHGDYFSDRITYEKYPIDQGEVDKILKAARLQIRVIYDPADSRQ